MQNTDIKNFPYYNLPIELKIEICLFIDNTTLSKLSTKLTNAIGLTDITSMKVQKYFTDNNVFIPYKTSKLSNKYVAKKFAEFTGKDCPANAYYFELLLERNYQLKFFTLEVPVPCSNIDDEYYDYYMLTNKKHICLIKYKKIFESLIGDPYVDFSMFHNFALCYSVSHGFVDLIKKFLKIKILRISIYVIARLITNSLDCNRLDIAEILLNDSRTSVTVQDNIILQHAVKNGHTDFVKILLLHPDVEPSCLNNYALRTAYYGGYRIITRLLLTSKKHKPSKDREYLNIVKTIH